MGILAVWNQALSAARARGRVQSLAENSPEQEVCEQWYETVARTVQAAAWWGSCRTTARLAQLSESDETGWAAGRPEPGYGYSFALPTNYLHAWYLSDFSRFAISYDSTRSRRVISTNAPAPIFTYARFNNDPDQWDQGQLMATIYALAAHISPTLSGQQSTVANNFKLANDFLEEARASTANEQVDDAVQSIAPWISARGYGSGASTRFFYPLGSLFIAG